MRVSRAITCIQMFHGPFVCTASTHHARMLSTLPSPVVGSVMLCMAALLIICLVLSVSRSCSSSVKKQMVRLLTSLQRLYKGKVLRYKHNSSTSSINPTNCTLSYGTGTIWHNSNPKLKQSQFCSSLSCKYTADLYQPFD